MTKWGEPTTCWNEDAVESLDTLRAQGELLATWPPAGAEREPTYCFRHGARYHIRQPGFGEVAFSAAEPSLTLSPLQDTDRTFFWTLVSRSWLPAIYPIWGRQVLHASAVVDRDGTAIGFSGPSGAGKSTMAYAFGRRAGWSILADDTIAFSCDADASAPISVHPLRLQSRLRLGAARHFGKPHESEEAFTWPDQTPVMTAVYILNGSDEQAETSITQESLADSYATLLNQALAMSLADPSLNHRLMRDYATLATTVDVFRLAYPKSFDALDTVLDCIESHIGQLKRRRAEVHRSPSSLNLAAGGAAESVS